MLQQRVHNTFAGFDFDLQNSSWHDHSPERRREILEETWADGSLSMWVGTFREVLVEEDVNDEMSEFVREKIRARIDDPDVAKILVPKRYGFGTYRVPLETGYYDVFNRDNVEVIDVREVPIKAFGENGLVLQDGREYELDVVILATGFDAGTGALTQMNIRGRDGRSLKEDWSKEL